ncbi:DUF3108 domain-containing protein [Gallaecimonas kandeliae]|uniref:DUF3108 domain-containing protein n=1 Tax=Gallaecimonas kandeliae TaxID=3029055 RepID=UPI0026477E23|nr:DUF3108 domain-containing protein [Gallaecimonas kandeliae]WKE66905.1 DUF3108 domain-containing protein [Gallaecimonas kandeliae]
MRLRNQLIPLALAALLALPVAASPLSSYDAIYKVLRKGKTLGMGSRSLEQDGDTYVLKNASDLRWLIFTDQRSEEASFKVQDGQVQSLRYSYKRTGTGPDDSSSQTTDGHTVRSGGAGINIEGTFYDPLSYQQQLALDIAAGKQDVSYHIVQGLKEKDYHFKVAGEERIKTPYGELDTLRVERVRGKNSSRQTIFWLAPSLNYSLVRLWQAKDGVEQMELVLAEYHGGPKMPRAEPAAAPATAPKAP